MSTNSGADNDPAELMSDAQIFSLGNQNNQQKDADGRIFYSGEFVSTQANKSLPWRWKLLRSGESLYNFCFDSLSDRAVTLSSVALYGCNSGRRVLLTEKNIGQPTYQSGNFGVPNSWHRFDEAFIYGDGIALEISLSWIEAKVSATTIPMSSDCVLEGLYAKVIDGGEKVFKLVSSDGQPFYINVAVFEAKSAYFKRFFATEGWKDRTEDRMVLVWTSAVVKQLIRYVYLNNIDIDICEHLPDILDAAQMWELVGLKAVIEAQMRDRLQKAAQDADTDTAAEYLKMAHLHNLTSLVPICNWVLADNYDRFFDSDSCKQMINSSKFCHLIKAVFHPNRNAHN